MPNQRMPGRKKANLVHSPRNPGLATIIATPELQKGTCKARTNSTCHSSVNAITPENGAAPVSGRMEDGAGKQGNTKGRPNSGLLLRVCLGSSVRSYSHSTAAEAREACRAPLDCNNVMRELITTPSSLPCSPIGRQRVLSENLTADDTIGKSVYGSLNGRHISAKLAASVTGIEGRFEAEDTQVCEELAPMYRVIILALFTTAASAVKDKNRIEIQRLLKIVAEQENELILMRQQLSNRFGSQDITEPYNRPSTQIVGDLPSLKNLQCPEFHDVGCLELDDAVKSVYTKVLERSDVNSLIDLRLKSPSPWNQGLRLGDGGDLLSEEDSEVARDDAVNKNVVLVETPGKESSAEDVLTFLRDANSIFEKCLEDEEKWYVNPMAGTIEDCYDVQRTPERENLNFAKYSPLTRRSHERTALKPSIGNRRVWNADYRVLPLTELAPASPLQVIPCRLSKESVTLVSDTRCMDEEVTALRVECAAVVLKLKSKVMTSLRKEAARCLAEQNLYSTEMKILVAVLLAAVARCWRETVPQALAALGLSPSEYNSCLLNNTQRKKPNVSECARDTDGWRQFLEEDDTNDHEAEQRSNRVAALCLCASNFEQLSICKSSKYNGREESPEMESTSFFSCAPEECFKSSENIEEGEQIAPDTSCSHQHSEESPESLGKFVSCWENPSKWLKNTSAQVADMELQMKRLQQDVLKFEANWEMKEQTYLRGNVVELESKATDVAGLPQSEVSTYCDRKRNHEANEMGFAELRRELRWKEREIAELKSEVESREILIADMERNRKDLMQAEFAEMSRQLRSKDYKILELSSEVQLKGLEVADLERQMKVKLHTDVAEMTRHIQLIESKFLELTTKLQSKDVEIADIERNQKEFLLAKDEELAALREECLRGHAHLDKVATAAQSTEIEKLSMISNLENLCGFKDNEISKLKQELRSVEMKINSFKPFQSPTNNYGRRSSKSNHPSQVNELEVTLIDSQEPHLHPTPQSPNCSICRQIENLHPLAFSEDEPSIAPTKVSDGCLAAAYEVEHHEPCYISPPMPPIPCYVEEQLDPKECDQGLQGEMEGLAGAGVFMSHDASSQNPTTLAQTMRPRKSNNAVLKTKRTDLRRVSMSTTGKNPPGPNRLRASLTFTSAAHSQRSGLKHHSKGTENPEKKLVHKPTKLRRKLVVSPPRAGQPGVKVLGPVSNTFVKTIKISADQNHGANPLVSDADGRLKENSAFKRRRWAA
ncbi:uncharacterized protein [Physcomitrium patens]|uniref:Uncharacterized protein n=1 Tax=Physcomitrium patens TaxID=3218 RepID=A0A2K1JJ83_PHYPA|nr:uncharacterized protein LOC112291659 isoform X1 [Physcomitrium patens]PNR41611.1 hypothetical protein PHYPA_019014 [Physcomitrium patens]|eukprot:XP_024395181.1 uncharacterized protein LOC112291659 isoform X1 [Physcomitrella patens]